jgi:hypothetical protein
MRPPSRLEAKQKSGAMRYIVFRQSPEKAEERIIWVITVS